MTSWSLLVATYNRVDILVESVALAIRQDPPPQQVVIVDASVEWEKSQARVEALTANEPQISLSYVRAKTPSGAMQRNQGLDLVDADVVFIFDDDTLMHPGAAANILRVYDADADQQVAGVQAGVAPGPPATFQARVETKDRGQIASRTGIIGAIINWIMVHIILFDADVDFIPYDRKYPTPPIPRAVSELDVDRTFTMTGYRATFRTSIAQAIKYDGNLLSYSPGEDADMSYRASSCGALVTLKTPDVHHFQSASGRLNRKKVETLAALNRAFFLRQHAPDRRLAKRRYRILMFRRILAEILKDGATRRFTFPQLRGVFAAMRTAPKIFAFSDQELMTNYRKIQERILNSI